MCIPAGACRHTMVPISDRAFARLVAAQILVLLSSVLGLALSGSPPPSVATKATFNISETKGIVYAQGLIYAGTPQQRVVNLTLDAYMPVQNDFGPPVPRGLRPAVMFVHGGGFVGSILEPDKAARVVDDVQYFVQRGFAGFQLNYRLADDNATFPTRWPTFPPVGGGALGVQPGPIPVGSPMFESQRFKLGTTGELSLANDSELCVHAMAPGGSVQIVPCDGASDGTTNNTVHWHLSGGAMPMLKPRPVHSALRHSGLEVIS